MLSHVGSHRSFFCAKKVPCSAYYIVINWLDIQIYISLQYDVQTNSKIYRWICNHDIENPPTTTKVCPARAMAKREGTSVGAENAMWEARELLGGCWEVETCCICGLKRLDTYSLVIFCYV